MFRTVKSILRQRLNKFMTFLKKRVLSEKFCLLIVAFSFILLMVTIVVFIVCGSWSFSNELCEEKIGQFGDFVGGLIGTILAFAASILYYIALKEQQKDVHTNQQSLEKQVEEFKNQVAELELSRRVYEGQRQTMALQQFETSFYSYFDIYLSLKSQFEKTNDDIDAFMGVIDCLRASLSSDELPSMSIADAHNITVMRYSESFAYSKFSHYYRTFYRLINMVVESPALKNENERMKYIKIIRSQLSDNELLVLYYNAHSKYAGNAKNLLYEYNFFKHLKSIEKVEILERYQYGDDTLSKLFLFCDQFEPFIVSCINHACDGYGDESGSLEAEIASLKLLIRFSFDEKLKFSLTCLDPQCLPTSFDRLVADILYDRIFIANYNTKSEEITYTNIIDPITKKTVIIYCVDENNIRHLIVDKDDE